MSKKNTLYYIFLTTVLATGLIFYFFSFPIVKKIESTKTDIQSKHTELEKLQKKETELKELEQNYKNFQEKIDVISKMFPKTKDVSDYITQLESTALMHLVGLNSIKVTGQSQNSKEAVSPQYTQLTKSGDFYELPIDITARSENYNNLLEFTKTIEKLSRFTSIKKISMKPLDCGKLEASISIIIYITQ